MAVQFSGCAITYRSRRRVNIEEYDDDHDDTTTMMMIFLVGGGGCPTITTGRNSHDNSVDRFMMMTLFNRSKCCRR